MPVFRSGEGQAPAWCEMQYFDIVQLTPGEVHEYERLGKKEKLIVGSGRCRIACGHEEVQAEEGTNLDLPDGEAAFAVREVEEATTLIRMCGNWGEELGGSGIFSVANSPESQDGGDPVAYEKSTHFDSHFHDCDEYWILFEGRGTAVSEGKTYAVGPGDCVATGMGHHHDFPKVSEPVRAVYFETTIEGQKRRGHLWDHTHGKAEPQADRG